MRQSLLRSVTVIQQSCVTAVRTQRNGCRKTVDRADSPRRRGIQELAAWQVNLPVAFVLCVGDKDGDNQEGSAATQQQLQVCLPTCEVSERNYLSSSELHARETHLSSFQWVSLQCV